PARPKATAFAYSSLARWASALESSRSGAAGFSAPRAARGSAQVTSANQRGRSLIGNPPASKSLRVVGHGEGDDLNRLELGAALEERTQPPQRLWHVFPRLDPSPVQGERGELAAVEVPAPGPALFGPLPGTRAGPGAPVLVGREGLRGGGQHEPLK